MIDSPLTGKTVFMLGPLPVDQAVVTTWAIMVVLGLGSWLITRRLSLKPGRLQSVIELVVTTIDRITSYNVCYTKLLRRLERERGEPLVGEVR